MDYWKIYINLVEKARNRKILPTYFEKHHILPKCMGGSDDASNIVNFTAREHFVAHKLLCKVYPERLDLKLAVVFLSGRRNSSDYINKNSKSYERFRLQYAEAKRASCRSGGTMDVSFSLKVPARVTAKTRSKFKVRKPSVLNLIVTNLLATGGVAISRNNGRRSVSVFVRGKWNKVPSIRALWRVIDVLESDGYVRVEQCPDTVPLPLRKRASVYPTEKLNIEFGDCVVICQDSYKESLTLTKFKYTVTGEIFYSNLPYIG